MSLLAALFFYFLLFTSGLQANLIETRNLIIDAKSGVSGAG